MHSPGRVNFKEQSRKSRWLCKNGLFPLCSLTLACLDASKLSYCHFKGNWGSIHGDRLPLQPVAECILSSIHGFPSNQSRWRTESVSLRYTHWATLSHLVLLLIFLESLTRLAVWNALLSEFYKQLVPVTSEVTDDCHFHKCSSERLSPF